MIARNVRENQLVQNLGANLRLHRVKLGLNQTDFGKLMSIGQNAISRMELGTYAPTLHQIYRLSKGLKVPVSALFGFKLNDEVPKSFKAFRLRFSERLRAAREARDLTQVELSELVQMKQPTYSKIETGAKSPHNPDKILSPDLETIRHIARALKIEPTALLFD